MITDNLDYNRLPLSLLFDRVRTATERSELVKLAQIYAQHEHFEDHRELMKTVNHRFEEADELAGKKNWAIFCRHVLAKKDYAALEQLEYSLDQLIEKIKAHPELAPYSTKLETLKADKREEHFAEWLAETICQAENPLKLKQATLAHPWFTSTLLLLKALEKRPFKQAQTESLLVLAEFEPGLVDSPKIRKIVRNMAVKEESPERSRRLMDWIYEREAFLALHAKERPGSKIHKMSPRRMLDDKLPAEAALEPVLVLPGQKKKSSPEDFELFLDKSLSHYKRGEASESEVASFAEDLYHRGLKLFRKCPLSEFIKLKWTKKGQAPHLEKFFNFSNCLEKLAKDKILEGRSPKEQARRMEFFIDLANHSFQMHDLNSCWALIMALESCEVSKLKEAAHLVDPHHKRLKETLFECYEALKNFKGLRQIAESCIKLEKPLVPFIAPFTKDLTFIHEGNPDQHNRELNVDKVELLGTTYLKLYEIRKMAVESSEPKSDIIYLIDKPIDHQ